MPQPQQNIASHHERLAVPLSWWLLAIAFAATLVVAVTAYLNLAFGIATALASLVVIGILMQSYGGTRVVVDDDGLQAGLARIQWPWVAGVEVLDESGVRGALGPGSLATAHLVTRPYVKQAVKVLVDDPADPHPFWVVSTRHPQQVAELVQAHLQQAGRGR